MEFKKFKRLRANYEGFIETAERDIHGDKAIKQTRSVWFDRETIEKLLADTDSKKGGIKIYFGQYDQDTLPEIEDTELRKEMDGRLTVILAASNENKDPEEETQIVNGGWFCPPHCG
ncbi:MAG: hypothetical protein JJU34_20190 [Lunatimonas sp.]|uniref:hypothetical protein n=1 Tax=Lunatimonas sp. TaxID=2060141 RepID=UPI00263AEB7B|nr:hypothetical protein [Lunatimonas sp.]MCC5939611.1 hypothetical protein [Lunatimonas sp.]